MFQALAWQDSNNSRCVVLGSAFVPDAPRHATEEHSAFPSRADVHPRNVTHTDLRCCTESLLSPVELCI